jgi:general secretion pathway protein I
LPWLCPSIDSESDSGHAGFTLIESLVALAIVAVALTAIGMLVAANIRATRSLEQRLQLIETARAILSALPDRDQLAMGDTRGEIAGQRWRLDVMAFSGSFVDQSVASPWIPQAVVLRVEAPTGEILRVDTVRLRRNPGGSQ